MPALGFSGVNLAVVAYAEVDGGTGASTACNSGITTTRTEGGHYLAILPTNLSQVSARDLIFVQPKGPGNASTPGASTVPKMAVVDDIDPTTKSISIFSSSTSTSVDSDFSLLILRTTISPPAGSPA